MSITQEHTAHPMHMWLQALLDHRHCLSSTYNLCLASRCYSKEKEDKSNRRRYSSERRRHKSNAEEDYRKVVVCTGKV